MSSMFGIPAWPTTGFTTSGFTTAPYQAYNKGHNSAYNSAYSMNAANYSTPARYIGYIASIFVIILIILMFIHYFVTPIFQLTPGGPGVIRIPFMTDGKVYWDKQPISPLSDTATILGTQTTNWSFTLDFFIEEPFILSSRKRILFNRGGHPIINGGEIENYNICIALATDANDLIISTTNVDNNIDQIVISNAPV